MKATYAVTNSGSAICYFYMMLEDHAAIHGTAGLPITRDFLRENPEYCKSRPYYYYQQNHLPYRLKMYRRIRDIEHVKELNPNSYSCTRLAGPALLTYLYVGCIPGVTTEAINPGSFSISIKYYCKLFDRNSVDA